MPTIANLSLSISSPSFSTVTLTVSYTATLSTAERFLADQGLGFEERIQIIGDDPGEDTDEVLHTLPPQALAFAPGETSTTATRQITVPRSTLDEDPGLAFALTPGRPFPSRPNPDQLVARVEVRYLGLDHAPARSDSAPRTLVVT